MNFVSTHSGMNHFGGIYEAEKSFQHSMVVVGFGKLCFGRFVWKVIGGKINVT